MDSIHHGIFSGMLGSVSDRHDSSGHNQGPRRGNAWGHHRALFVHGNGRHRGRMLGARVNSTSFP
ncbi:unnamed protein product [Sphacelaria rigidula]